MIARRGLLLALIVITVLIFTIPSKRQNAPQPRADRAASIAATTKPLAMVATPATPLQKTTPSSGGVWHLPLPITAQLPESFNDWERVSCGDFSSGARPLGANASRRETVADGKSLYRDAFPGCDVTFDPQQYKVEEFITLRETSAQHEWTWELDLQHGALKPRLTPMHSVELVDAQGTPRVRIDPPSGKDANGKVLSAGEELVFTLDGNRLTLKANVKDCATPIVIDPSFSSTGTMAVPRQNHTATVLPSGKVLIAGGYDTGSAYASCELFDPATRTFSATGSMLQARAEHGAVLLQNNKVFVLAGRAGYNGTLLVTAEIYDPATGTWSAAATPPGSQVNSSYYFRNVITLLQDGRVLAIVDFNQTELYSPGTDSWATSGNAVDLISYASLATLNDGRVIAVSGGGDQLEVQIYDPGTGMWSRGPNLADSTEAPLLIKLNNGRIFAGNGTALQSCDPNATNWISNAPSTPFSLDNAAGFPDGRLLIPAQAFGTSEGSALLDTATNLVTATVVPPVGSGKLRSSFTTLNASQVLLAGGINGGVNATNLAFLFDGDTPDVTLSASPTQIVQNESVLFSSSASTLSGGSLTYAYDFGDGSTGSGPNTSHTFTSAGVFTVTVTVTSASGKTNSASTVITVLSAGDRPTARFVTSDVVGFVGAPLAFDAIYSTDPQNSISSYSWNFGDGSPDGSGQSISHIYTASGTYNATLTVTDAQGLTSSLTRPIVVLDSIEQGLFNSGIAYKVRWDRTKTAADSLTLTATVNVGDATVGAGTPIALEIAGQRFTGTLDGKLRDKETNLNWQVKANLRKQAFGEADIKVTIKKADLGAGFNSAGIVAGTDLSEKVEANVPIHLELAGKTFEIPVPSEFKFGNEGKRASGSGDGP